MNTTPTVDSLIAELRELSRDVSNSDMLRRRRLAVLRRLEVMLQDGERSHALAIA